MVTERLQPCDNSIDRTPEKSQRIPEAFVSQAAEDSIGVVAPRLNGENTRPQSISGTIGTQST